MGYAKYNEDILEDSYYNRSDSGLINDNLFYSKVNSDTLLYKCRYCGKLFDTKNELYNHVRKIHNYITSILIVEGKVVNKDIYVKSINSVLVIRYNIRDDIMVNNIKITKHEEDYEIDLTEYIKNVLITNKTVCIKVGIKEFRIKFIANEIIDLSKIRNIVRLWDDSVSKGYHVNKNIIYENDCNEIEMQCLYGVLNYYLGCISNNNDKENRYNDAFAILSEFINIVPFVKIYLKVIAFNFNWVDVLRRLCVENDVFLCMYNFFIGTESNGFSNDGKNKIFVEDDLSDIIEIILNYQKKGSIILDELTKKYCIKDIFDMDNINLKDKFCLVFAKCYSEKGNVYETRRFYDEISSPNFDKEY